MTALAHLLHTSGDNERAEAHAQNALALHRATGNRPGEARTLLLHGRILTALHQPNAARDAWHQPEEAFTETAMGEAREATDLLTG